MGKERGAMDRRGFLGRGAGALGGVVGGVWGGAAVGATAPRLEQDAACIGRAVIACGAIEGRRCDLDRALMGLRGTGGVEPAALLRTETLARQVHRDFTDGHVVQVNGWVLSLTEARVCAVVALDLDGTDIATGAGA